MHTSIWLYPWDLLDGGARPVLERIAALGLKGVHLATSYHSVEALLPHNPRRRTFRAERAALYFQLRPEHWHASPLQPSVSPLVAEQGDALAEAGPICKDLGLELVSWTVCLHNTELASRYPTATVRNLRGEHYEFALCPANPGVRAYLRVLVRDLRDRVDGLELESPHWMPFPHQHHAKWGLPKEGAVQLLLNLCFCRQCAIRAAQAGLNLLQLQARLNDELERRLAAGSTEDVAAEVAELIEREPDLARLLQVRQDTVTSLGAELAREAGSTPVYSMPFGPAYLTGADSRALAAVSARLEVLAYGSAAQVSRDTREALAEAGGPDRLLVGLSALNPATPDRAALLAAFQAASEAGARYACVYNYGLMSPDRFDWLRDALAM